MFDLIPSALRNTLLGLVMLALSSVLPSDGVVMAHSPIQEEGGEAAPVSNLEDVQKAVVRIEAVGTFVSPGEEEMRSSWSGSGFIISPDGIAVTNNHVVTGAAFLKVYVEGEKRPRNARILGVSECADLAVIDINGSGFPFLDWYAEEIRVGLDVYAAGFPFGDPEYTLTRGIIAKARADGDTYWASVPNVLQHDATTNRGNSGGPLVTHTGQVVGINYGGRGTNEYFAISRDEFLPILETLQEGQDIDSIGINGEIISVPELPKGIWVSSVATGSPADEVGIQAGDLLYKLENVSLVSDDSNDETMADYCHILRSHARDDVMSVEVLRFRTLEVLVGQINGKPLEFNPGDNGQQGSTEQNTTYEVFVPVTDKSGFISVQIPEEWTEVETGAWGNEDDVIGYGISASADLEGYRTDWDEPGLFLGVSAVLIDRYGTPEAYLDQLDYSGECTDFERIFYAYTAYPQIVYIGYYNLWTNCGDNKTTYVNVAPDA